MTFTAAVAVLCTLFSALCLLTVIAVVRRVRLLEADLEPFLATRRSAALPPGTTPPAFSAVTTDGSPIGSEDLLGGTGVLAFFSVSCQGCREQIPAFLELVRRTVGDPVDGTGGNAPGARTRAVAVVSGDRDAGQDMVAALGSGCAVVCEPDNGPLTVRMAVNVFPTFAVLDADGVVVESGNVAGSLAVPASLVG